MDTLDTIVAIASAAGGALRGVVRLSGPQAVQIARTMIDPSALTDGEPVNRQQLDTQVAHGRPFVFDSTIGLVWKGAGRSPLPAQLLIWPGQRSYTREPTVEIHTLGSPPLLEAVVRAACGHGARLAQPGEFTLRAFLAGRIDLTQAEAVLGVIDAHGPETLQTALQQLAGGMAGPLQAVREELLLLLADLEAGLDFAEEDIEFIAPKVLQRRLDHAAASVGQLVAQLKGRSDSAELPRVVLVGPVNAGKSSLFNALVQRWGAERDTPSAIVSPQPGATRDFLSARVEYGGTAWELVDTAGIETTGPEPSIRLAAQQMTARAYEQATLRLRCHAAQSEWPWPSIDAPHELFVITKGDTATRNAAALVLSPDEEHRPTFHVTSTLTGEGLPTLMSAIAEHLLQRETTSGNSMMVPSTELRCGDSLRLAQHALAEAQQLVTHHGGEELIATEIRLALDQLGQVAGTVYTEDVLDRVFSRFCIGK